MNGRGCWRLVSVGLLAAVMVVSGGAQASAMAPSAPEPRGKVVINDGRDAPSKDGDIQKVTLGMARELGRATIDVQFFKRPSSFFYVDFKFGRSSYGMCSVWSGGQPMWASFDPFASGRASSLRGKIESKSVQQLNSTTWRYVITSPQLRSGGQDCLSVETGFFRDYERWDSDCSCFTRIVDWDEAIGRL